MLYFVYASIFFLTLSVGALMMLKKRGATTDDGVTPESTIVSETLNINGLYSVSSFYNFFNPIQG